MGKKAQYVSFSTDITLAMIRANFMQYVLGAITLAIVSGVIFGVLTYGTIKLYKSRKSNRKNTI